MFIGYENAARLTKALSRGKRTPRVSNLFKRLDANTDGVEAAIRTPGALVTRLTS
jgi:hypothetical protein